jgi:hypothetical protein
MIRMNTQKVARLLTTALLGVLAVALQQPLPSRTSVRLQLPGQRPAAYRRISH